MEKKQGGGDDMILREWNAFWNGRFHSIDQPSTLFFIPSQWSIPFHFSFLHTKRYLRKKCKVDSLINCEQVSIVRYFTKHTSNFTSIIRDLQQQGPHLNFNLYMLCKNKTTLNYICFIKIKQKSTTFQ
ncbi:hypothetical protein HanLR1_Chr16g0620531 [Helianthus annuus]|nr:hypothetical protein HanLR1_Chr16g0620531 [Helianthus annuus]